MRMMFELVSKGKFVPVL